MRTDKMLRTAVFSPCRRYRYALSRLWTPKRPRVIFVGLNPSTADEQKDDPTVRRCINFARKWNFGSLLLVNLFAYRSTDPDNLFDVDDPIGPANDDYILTNARTAERIVVAWGAKGGFLHRDQHVLALLPGTHCLGCTKDGHPKHPLYLPSDTRVRPFKERRAAA